MQIGDPAIGRFTSPDSLVPDPYDPRSYNRYSYVTNNPLKYTDPTGHCGATDLLDPNMPRWMCSQLWDESNNWLFQQHIGNSGGTNPVAVAITTVVSFLPGPGDVIDAGQLIQGIYDRSPLEIFEGGIGFVPILGDPAQAVSKGLRRFASALVSHGDEAMDAARNSIDEAAKAAGIRVAKTEKIAGRIAHGDFTAEQMIRTSRAGVKYEGNVTGRIIRYDPQIRLAVIVDLTDNGTIVTAHRADFNKNWILIHEQ